MTEFMEKLNTTSLVHVGGGNKTEYLQIFNKKRKTRWDEPIRPCKRNKNLLTKCNLPYLDIKNSRRTRWGADYEKTFIPMTITKIPDEVDIDTFEILIRKNRLEDINRRLQTQDWENQDPDLRSLSPEPIYDSKTGIRLNTREVRTKEKYVKEKNSIIEELILLDKNYKPPNDYRPPKKIKKIYINESDNEKHKLVGLILGPHGVTQKELEKKSGCRISVRGRGSNWNNNTMDKSYHDEMEPLHVFLIADTEESIRKGISLVEPILDPFSEEHMKHKQMQKNAIAVMYGYQTETACENCGERHRTWACPLNFGNFTKADVKCSICGEKSHPTVDCPERNNIVDKTEEESDLLKFIREIDEFKKNAEILVLEAERKADDIRNSVIFTGRIPDKREEEVKVNGESIVHTNEEQESIFNKENISDGSQNDINRELNRGGLPHNEVNKNMQIDTENKIYNINQLSNNLPFPININQPLIPQVQGQAINTGINPIFNQLHMNSQLPINIPMPNINTIRPSNIPLDYKLPNMPIVDNPNVIRAGPISYTNPNIPQQFIPNINPHPNINNPQNMNNYMNPNPYIYPNNMPYAAIPSNQYANTNSYHYNRGLNFISSNFQGKIPTSYGHNSMNYMRPPMHVLNMPINPSNVNIPNYRVNPVINQPNVQNLRPPMGMGNIGIPFANNNVNFSNQHITRPDIPLNDYPLPPEPEPEQPNEIIESDDIQIEKV
jgi:hypothetical protein